jgi:uncharacterized 2Fe-2S/4Fe-4S cluster protein (DUF4445 family)
MTDETSRILFAPSSKEATGAEGTTILEAAREAGVYIDAPCSGKGLCGGCRVRVMEGEAEAPSEQESGLLRPGDGELGYRLACMARIRGDMTVFVPQESVLGQGEKPFTGRSGVIDPVVRGYCIDLAEGDGDQARVERVARLMAQQYGIRDLITDVTVLKDLGRTGGDLEGRVTVLVRTGKEIIGVLPGWDARYLGLALDIGTTTIAAYVGDLRDGQLIATGSATNPQVLFGSDIMSRISYSSRHPDGARRMQTALIASIDALVRRMAESRGFDAHEIVDATVVGNTVMHHIFLGIPPDRLGLWPFMPTLRQSLDVLARDLGIGLGRASYLHILPLEAGFVGADNVGVLLSDEPHRRAEISLIMDLGTNGEIVLGNRERLLCCSCATGPALEGAHISSGMRAIEGAIEKVRIDAATFEVDYAVVGKEGWARDHGAGLEPAGLCGSGIIDAVAHLYTTGLIGEDGAFSQDRRTARLRKGEAGMMEFVVAWRAETRTGRDIVLTQKDIREVQLAKAALYAGCRVLMDRLKVASISRMVIAGAFGMHIDKASALTLGLFPPCDPAAIAMVGNAAGHGAYLALMDKEKRKEADRVAPFVTHVELAREEAFQREFMNGLSIPFKRS